MKNYGKLQKAVVLGTILAGMHCCYVEAAMNFTAQVDAPYHFIDDSIITVVNPSYHYEAGISANGANITIDKGKTLTINIGGTSGDTKANPGIVARGQSNITVGQVTIHSVDVGVLASYSDGKAVINL